jgi:hypothetical protein
MLEERRIEVALDALTIAYKTKFVFEHIRGVLASSYEWNEMRQLPGDTDDKRQRRGSYYAAFKRIERNKEYFDGLWQLQPNFMAIFGAETENIFLKVHKARRHIEVAAQMLFQNAVEPPHEDTPDTRKLWRQLRGDLWEGGGGEVDNDRVGSLLIDFKNDVEAICLPVVAEFRSEVRK